jgi:Na+/pantothenate symporter
MAGGLTHAVETLEAIDPKLVSPQGADDILSDLYDLILGVSLLRSNWSAAYRRALYLL